MELQQALRTTPATREFTNEPVSDDVVFSILDDARFAPNGGNRQAWKVIVVRDGASKQRLGELWDIGQREDVFHKQQGLVPFVASEAFWRNPPGGPNQPAVDLDEARRTPIVGFHGANSAVIEHAPVLLVVVLNLTRVMAMDSGLGRLSISAGGSVYPFCHNILLAARDRGYGGVITSVLSRQEPAVKALLNIPDEYALAAVIPLGRPVKEITKLKRNQVAEFTTRETFDGARFPA
ncbi:MAG: nitroreductase family protein [Acidimicrobiia bacterium]